MSPPRSYSSPPAPVALISYAELRAHTSRREIDRELAQGRLIRVRKGTFVPGGCPAPLLEAARHGGRLDCVSLLRARGIFVLDREGPVHIQMDRGTTRAEPRSADVVRHWRKTRAVRAALHADLIEALAQACRCQEPRAALATLDSAWHLGLIGEGDLTEVFRRLPQRYGALRPLLDRRSESGSETMMRLLLRTLGVTFELQVVIVGVGRVDFLVDGWLIIECDSEAHHAGWDAQRRDRRRDLAAAALGYTTLRPIAEDIMHDPGRVLRAVRGLLAARRTVHNVGNPRAKRRS